MQTVDYTKALQNYRTSQGFMQAAIRPQRNATLASAIGRMLTGYFANKGMNNAQHGMSLADQAQKDERAVDFSQALGAYRGDTPYQMSEDELMPGEEPIEGLRTMGQGQDRMAMAEAMMGAKAPGLQTAGLQMLAERPEQPSAPTIKSFATGEMSQNGKPMFQDAAFVNGDWSPVGKTYPKGGSGVTVNNNMSTDSPYGKMEAGMMPNPNFDKAKPLSEDNPYYVYQPGGSKDPAAKNQKDLAKLNATADKTMSALDRYEGIFDKTGTKLKPDADKMSLNTAYKDLMLQLKELFNLGVLNGPDLQIMEEYLQNPTSGAALVYEAFGGKEGFKNQIRLVRDKIQSEIQINRDVFTGSTIPTVSTQAQFDALEPGEKFIENGVEYIKP